MKKVLFIIILFFASKVDAQFQPMAILPEAMRSATGFNSLCLDLFADAPTSRAVYDVPGAEARTIRGVNSRGDYRHMHLGGSRSALSGEHPTFVVPRGNASRAVDARLQEFATQKISAYNTPAFKTSQRLQSQLQDEIWSYNVVDSKGYLSHSGDVMDDYNSGIRRFKRDYGITGPGVSKVAEIGDIEHTLRKSSAAFDIEGSSIVLKNLSSSVSIPVKNIRYDFGYQGERNIILNNKDAIIGNFELQYIRHPHNMRLEIRPYNSHSNHSLIIHVEGHADMSIPLSDNNHTVLYRPSANTGAIA